MADVLRSTESDLAFMKALVEGDHRLPEGFGAIYAMTGLVYGLEIIAGWLQLSGTIALTASGFALVHGGFSIFYLIVLACMIALYRTGLNGSGVTARTFAAIFASVGCAMLSLVAVLAIASWRFDDWTIVTILPAVACALQGAAWLAAYMVRMRLWLGAIAAGWFLTAAGTALTLGTPAFLLILGLAFLFLMIGPGIAIMRIARAG